MTCTNKHKIDYEHNQPINLSTQTMNPYLECEEDEFILMATIVTSLVQKYSLKVGVKKFGTKGQQAIFDKMSQLHQHSCFYPIDVDTLIPQECTRVLNSLTF